MPEVIVKGMICPHCAGAVKKALEGLAGISEVEVDLDSGRVTFASTGPVSWEELARVIKAAGYDLATN